MDEDVTPNEPDPIRLAAWRGLLNAHAVAVGAIEREVAAAGDISLVWYDVLVALSEAPEQRLRLHQLAEAVVLSRSGLTRLLDRLGGAGLIARAPCPADRRGAFAVLTPSGAAAVERTWPFYARGISRHFAAYLSEEEARLLAVALERVAAGDRAS